MNRRAARAIALAVGIAVMLPWSQGDLQAQSLKNERRQHAWAQRMQTELLRHCLQLPAKPRAAIAEILARCDGSQPLQTLGAALAAANGVKADSELLFRSGLVLFAMPEVVDPVGMPDDPGIPHIDAVSITVWAPRTMDLTVAARFALRIQDAGGKTVWSGEIRKDTGMSELREFLTHKAVPVNDLRDGLYWVEADTILADKKPRAGDPRLRVPFWVLRGFVKRRLALLAGVRQIRKELDPLPWALVSGSDRVVHRFFSGEPGADTGACLRELIDAERVLNNLRNDKPPLTGAAGWVTLELPNQEMWHPQVALRMMPDKQAGAPPSLVLFVPGAPAWNPRGRRPRSPESVEPGFLVEMLKTSGFDHQRRWQLVVVESPGRVRNTLQTLRNVLAMLPKVVRYDRQKVFLIGDRQGAAAVASLALSQPGSCRGLVLSNGGTGALTLAHIEKLGDTRVLVIPGHGHAASEGLRLHYEIAKAEGMAAHVRLLSERKWPWSIALPLASREIEAFVAGTLDDREPPAAAAPRRSENRSENRPESRPASRPASRSFR
ncbi:MAG: hypothetical protein ACYTGW_11360 [Planctomycetota bacterium]